MKPEHADRTREFIVEGHALRYELLGEGEPLLFLGNIATAPFGMRAFAPEFASAGYQLLLVDHPGPGETTVPEIARHVGALLDTLGCDPCVLGYSQGAFVAQELLLQRGPRIPGAVLLATRGRPTRFLAEYLQASQELAAESVPDRAAAVFSVLATLSPALVADDDQAEFALWRADGARGGLDRARHARSLRVSAAYGDRLAALGGVRVPCLVLSFEHDMICPPALGREVAEAIPGARYREVPGAGHGGLVTHAAEVLEAVTGFLDRCRKENARGD